MSVYSLVVYWLVFLHAFFAVVCRISVLHWDFIPLAELLQPALGCLEITFVIAVEQGLIFNDLWSWVLTLSFLVALDEDEKFALHLRVERLSSASRIMQMPTFSPAGARSDPPFDVLGVNLGDLGGSEVRVLPKSDHDGTVFGLLAVLSVGASGNRTAS